MVVLKAIINHVKLNLILFFVRESDIATKYTFWDQKIYIALNTLPTLYTF